METEIKNLRNENENGNGYGNGPPSRNSKWKWKWDFITEIISVFSNADRDPPPLPEINGSALKEIVPLFGEVGQKN